MKTNLLLILLLAGLTASSADAADLSSAIGPVVIKPVEDPKAERHFTMTVPVQFPSMPKADARNLSIQISFYDFENGRPVVTAAVIASRWISAPLDWRRGGTQTFEVDFAQRAGHGLKFVGYVIRLYDRTELQATRAEPASLASISLATQSIKLQAIH